jgi:hypothetical protein
MRLIALVKRLSPCHSLQQGRRRNFAVRKHGRTVLHGAFELLELEPAIYSLRGQVDTFVFFQDRIANLNRKAWRTCINNHIINICSAKKGSRSQESRPWPRQADRQISRKCRENVRVVPYCRSRIHVWHTFLTLAQVGQTSVFLYRASEPGRQRKITNGRSQI